MRIRIQEPPECVSRSETLVENFCKNGNFSQKLSLEQKFFAKTFAAFVVKNRVEIKMLAKFFFRFLQKFS
jgi:hypothetical protein